MLAAFEKLAAAAAASVANAAFEASLDDAVVVARLLLPVEQKALAG